MSTSANPFNQWGDGSETESHELNERAPFNHKPNTYMTGDGREESVESLNIDTMKAKDSTVTSENKRSYLDEMPSADGCTQFLKYSEQIKSILAGLLLLICGGMHTVWTIYQVSYDKTSELYREDLSQVAKIKWPERYFEVFLLSGKGGLLFTILMWYFGMAIGCFISGWYLVPKIQKKNVYYIAAVVMFASGLLFYGSAVFGGWQSLMSFGRLVAGIAHGITYVTVFVHASENASKDFRRIIVTIIGITIGLSLFCSATFFICIPTPVDELLESDSNVAVSSQRMSSHIIATVTIALCILSAILNFFFSHETVPFLLYHNYRQDEAQFAISRLLFEDRAAPIVQHEFEAMREMCVEDHAEHPEGKIFTKIHRRLMFSIALSSRITSAQCFYILSIIMFFHYIQDSIVNDLRETPQSTAIEHKNKTSGLDMLKGLFENTVKDLAAPNRDDKSKWLHLKNLETISTYIVRWSPALWFICGLPLTLISNYFNWKRGLHFTTFLVGVSMVLFTLFHWFGILYEFVRHFAILFLTIYINFLALSIDTLGYSYLMECFPTSTKSRAIAFVTICEFLFSAIFILIGMEHKKLGIEYIIMGLLFSILGFRLYAVVPNTNGLSLAAAKHAYIQAVPSFWWQFYKTY